MSIIFTAFSRPFRHKLDSVAICYLHLLKTLYLLLNVVLNFVLMFWWLYKESMFFGFFSRPKIKSISSVFQISFIFSYCGKNFSVIFIQFLAQLYIIGTTCSRIKKKSFSSTKLLKRFLSLLQVLELAFRLKW